MSSDLLKPLKGFLTSIVPDLESRGEPVTVKKLRAELETKGWIATAEEWKGEAKAYIMETATELLKGSSSPVKQPATKKEKEKDTKPSKTKYEKVAEKNLGTFMNAIAGPAGDDDEDEEDDEDFVGGDEDGSASGSGSGSESGSDSASESGSESEEEAPKKATKKATATKKKGGDFKSAETVEDSEDEGGAAEEGSEEPEDGGSKKDKATVKPKKEKVVKEKKEKKLPPPKEGDAPRGTDEEEEEIRKFKALLSAAGTKRPFTNTTGPERTLSASERKTILVDLLKEAGLKPTSSMSKAKEVGERRELEKEAKELAGVPIFEGLRGGKKRLAIDSDAEEDEEEGRPAKKVPPPKKFGAFLGDQSSDSD